MTDEDINRVWAEGEKIIRNARADDKRREKANARRREERARAAELRAKYPPATYAAATDITPEWVAYRVEQDIDEWDEGCYRDCEIYAAIMRAIAQDDSSPWQAVARAAAALQP